MSVVSVGIHYSETEWKLCLLREGEPDECVRFQEPEPALRWIAEANALHPELTIGLSIQLDCAFSPLSALQNDAYASSLLSDPLLQEFLSSLTLLGRQRYCLPSVKHLVSVPVHRRLLYPVMSTSDTLCSIATLLYRMRQNQASWSEMCFLCLEIGEWQSTITVVQNGFLIDNRVREKVPEHVSDEETRQAAFWEGLIQDLGGLMAVHQFEDIVISQRSDSAEARICKEQVIERLGDLYQCYLYPQNEYPHFEVCIGAALLVSGLSTSSPAAELSTHLLTVVPEAEHLNDHR